MHIYIIRHGETEGNKNSVVQGRLDLPLNEDGRLLARLTGEKLKDIKFDVCYSSPLLRAKQTAEEFLKASGNLDTKIIYDDRIREIDMGLFEGKTLKNKSFDVLPVTIFNKNPFIVGKVFGGESIYSVIKRTSSFLKELSTMPYENVLVSTHGCALRCMLNGLYDNRLNFWQGHVPYNCVINVIEVNDGKMKLVEKDKVYYDSKYIVDRYK